jgi:NADH dehydrogenase (ubiquinone) 1 alpha subcomplex subunit 10
MFCFYGSKHSELLVYDWSSLGDVEVVVEDIERINFDNYETEDPKMEDWRCLYNEWDWHDVRHRFAHDKDWLKTLFHLPVIKSEEFLIDGDDAWVYENVLQKVKHINIFGFKMGTLFMVFLVP